MSPSRSIGQRLNDLFSRIRPGLFFLVMILGALVAFEIFNYSTTDHALQDLLGNLEFGTLRWSTILALAFCGIDFAGIARLFTPEQGMDEPKEVWYLFGAWLLAAAFNAALTWWGVSVAIVNHSSAAAGSVVSSHTLTTLIPIFVAVMVLLIRVLIIGTFSVAGDNLFTMGDSRTPNQRPYQSQAPRPAMNQMPGLRTASSLPRPTTNYRPAPKPPVPAPYEKAEPTYHNIAFDASSNEERDSNRHMQ